MANLRVGYQGVNGSYSSIAVKSLFGQVEAQGFEDFESVLESLAEGKIDTAVLPSDNTVIGSIFEVYDLLFHHAELVIIGEVMVKLEHRLMFIDTGKTGPDRLAQIKQVYSHPKALAQCRSLFKKHPEMTPIVHPDTAGAAQFVSQSQNPNLAAIASQAAANQYHLAMWPEKVQDNDANYTRFLVLSPQKSAQTHQQLIQQPKDTKYKTSIVFVAAHQPGSLLACMQPFAQAGLNLTKIESRPLVGSAWEYLFFLDFEHIETNGDLTAILNQVRPHTQMLRNLGTYRVGETIVT